MHLLLDWKYSPAFTFFYKKKETLEISTQFIFNPVLSNYKYSRIWDHYSLTIDQIPFQVKQNNNIKNNCDLNFHMYSLISWLFSIFYFKGSALQCYKCDKDQCLTDDKSKYPTVLCGQTAKPGTAACLLHRYKGL